MKKGKEKMNNSFIEMMQSDDEVSKLIKITIVIVVIFLAFYFITKIGIDRNKKNNLEMNDTQIQFEEILVGNILNEKDEDYYVLIKFEDDIYLPLYNDYFEEYHIIEDSLRKYSVNINNLFNKQSIGEELSLKNGKYKFKESTLLKIKQNQIVEYYEGKESIVKYLKKIIDK